MDQQKYLSGINFAITLHLFYLRKTNGMLCHYFICDSLIILFEFESASLKSVFRTACIELHAFTLIESL